MKIQFAFAVNYSNRFGPKHFGKNIQMVNHHCISLTNRKQTD